MRVYSSALNLRPSCAECPGETIDGPLVHGHGIKREVEVDAGLVPIQTGPLQSATTPFHGDLGQPLQEGFANSFTPVLWLHKQVFQIDPSPSEEGREIVEKKGKAHRLFVFHSENDFCLLLFKNPLPQEIFRGYHFIQHVFIACQFSDELEDLGDIAFLRISDRDLTHGCSSRFFCVFCSSTLGYNFRPNV